MVDEDQVSLHVVSTAALLRTLDRILNPPRHRMALPERLQFELKQLAALPRTPRGALDRLEQKYGWPRKVLRVHIYNLRHKPLRHGWTDT